MKDLPHPTAVHCAIPNGLFGDFLMILEFFFSFGDELQLAKDAFPAGLSFELLERAVVENEVSGPLSDILQVLLSSLFEFQDAEAEEVKEAQNGDQPQDHEVTESGPTYQVNTFIRHCTIVASVDSTVEPILVTNRELR